MKPFQPPASINSIRAGERVTAGGRGLPIALHNVMAAIGVLLTAGEISPYDSTVPTPVFNQDRINQ